MVKYLLKISVLSTCLVFSSTIWSKNSKLSLQTSDIEIATNIDTNSSGDQSGRLEIANKTIVYLKGLGTKKLSLLESPNYYDGTGSPTIIEDNNYQVGLWASYHF
ncbi:MAG: hypothetical protein ISR65_09860 [Bacteriovoracaceae bacterium]|nr:hypothetical protein [Bacteriovoracaceae bacterium]